MAGEFSPLGTRLLLLVVAVAARALRKLVQTPRIGGQVAHFVGTLVVAVVIATIITVCVSRI